MKMIQAFLSSLLLIMTVKTVISDLSNENSLNIDFGSEKHLQVGKGIQLECRPSKGEMNLTWILPNGTKANNHSQSRIYHINGILQVNEATVNDSGVYTCISETSKNNATIKLVVYVIPTFYLESMIIVGINCFLVALFFLCYLYTIFYRRWKTNSKNKKVENSHEKKRFVQNC